MRHAVVLLFAAVPAFAATPTFSRDIAPIVFAYCAACHRPGEAAPFSLLTYRDVARRAKQIAVVTKSHYMPPWLPEPGKGDFADDRRLTAEQIRLIQEWSAAGAPEGEPSLAPPSPKFVPGWQLGKPDLVLTLPTPYTVRASGSDVFRNFVLQLPVDGTQYVRAMEIRPGNTRVVHHANVLLDRSGWSRRRDGADGSPGFDGMDVRIETRGFDPESHFLFWKPGTTVSEEPPDMAWRVDPGTDLVLNMHLQPSGKSELLQPSVGLYFTDKAPTKLPMLVQLENDGALDIPPGQKEFVVTDSLTLPVDVDVLGVYPHAHYLGKDLQGYATLPDGSRRWLIHIPDWDINWQSVYRYREPLFLPKGAVVSMRFSYDNSAANPRNPNRPPERVRNGDRSSDEMAHLWLQVLPRGTADQRPAIQEAVMRRRLEKYPSDFLARFTLGSLLQARGDLEQAMEFYRKALQTRPQDPTAHTALGAALLASGDASGAAAEFAVALKADPDDPNAHYNLSRILFAQNHLGEGIAHLREVVRIDPRDAPALSDLGGALLATGAAEEALKYLRQAVRLRPDYFNGRYNLGQALAATGRTEEAAAEFRAALKLQPDDADTRDALAKLGR